MNRRTFFAGCATLAGIAVAPPTAPTRAAVITLPVGTTWVEGGLQWMDMYFEPYLKALEPRQLGERRQLGQPAKAR